MNASTIRFGCSLVLIFVWFVVTIGLVTRCTAAHAAPPAPRITVTCQDVVIDTDQSGRVLLEYIRPDRIATRGLQPLDTGQTRLRHNAAIGTTLRVSVFPASAGLSQARETVQVPMCRWWYPMVGGG